MLGAYRLFEIRVEAENAFGKAPQEALVILGRSGEDSKLHSSWVICIAFI